MIGSLALAAVLLSGALVLAAVLHGGRSATTGTSSLGRQFLALGDGTLRSCPPDRTQPDAFADCVSRYRAGLDGMQLPSADRATVDDVHNLVQLVTACRSSHVSEDGTMRDWTDGCPQHGPATADDADAQDRSFRSQYYGLLLRHDAAIATSLGVANPAPSPTS